jgi:hypothetical protein
MALVSRCHGMLFAPAPRLVEDVRAAAAAARPYTCVNVRTEMTNAVGNPHCPGHIHAAAARAWAALPEARNGTKLIVSRIRVGSAGSADRSRPSSTNTGTSGSACAILLETRRTRRRAWRRNPQPLRRTRPASRSPKESEKGAAAGRDASATRGATATGTARAGSARRDRKRWCLYS